MNRRRLLATVATGTLGAIAGCGYAYGGGDLREEASVGVAGLGSVEYVLGDDRIVAALNGRIVDHDAGGFVDGARVGVSTTEGDRLWSYVHEAEAVDVTASDPVYLLDERGYLVAIAAVPVTDDELGVERSEETELWRVLLDDSRPPIASDERGAYVPAGDGLVAIREGEVAWELDVGPEIESIVVTGEAILVTTGVEVLALSPSGSERWRVEVDASPSFAVAGERVCIQGRRRITVRDLASGEELWTDEFGGFGGPPATFEDRVYVVDRTEISAYDAVDGGRLWQADGVTGGLEFPLVAAPEGVYGVRRGCEVVAIDGSGTRWAREVSVRDCSPVGGWLDGETVALLFESGELGWLQRTDQDPGLL